MSVGSSGQQGAYGGTLGAAASELGAVGQAADGQVPCCEHPLPSAVEDVVFWASPAAHINPDGESSGSPGLPPAPRAAYQPLAVRPATALPAAASGAHRAL